MEQRELVDVLAKLHAELSKSDQVDPATLVSLQTLTADLNRLLSKQGGQAGAVAAEPDDVEPVTRGLRDLLLEFEAEHPQLSGTLGKVADVLAAMGI